MERKCLILLYLKCITHSALYYMAYRKSRDAVAL